MECARTPLYEAHRALGAKVVPFAGWEMPLSYRGPAEEHRAVREHCGLFDVSHMGEVELRGPGAMALAQQLTVNDVERLGDGDGQYTVLCNPDGGVIDDLIIYRLGSERLLLVVNASGTPGDLAWIRSHAGDVTVVDRSAELALLALQGPDAERALRTLTPANLSAQRPFTLVEAPVAGIPAMLSRTGYTGEDGFEIFVDAGAARDLWDAVLAAAERHGGMPAGLAARDTLRLEAGLPLNGTDMDTTTTPLEARLDWVVKLRKPEFIGRSVLAAQAANGPPRRLVGVRLDEAGIPRQGYPVWRGGERVGVVTSGTKSPSLGTFIGMAYVAAPATATGTALDVEIRGRRVPATVVDRPFYRRKMQGKSHAGS